MRTLLVLQMCSCNYLAHRTGIPALTNRFTDIRLSLNSGMYNKRIVDIYHYTFVATTIDYTLRLRNERLAVLGNLSIDWLELLPYLMSPMSSTPPRLKMGHHIYWYNGTHSGCDRD